MAAKQLFDVQAAGIMLADADGHLRWASASDERAQTLEDNQEVFAAGPCAQAFKERERLDEQEAFTHLRRAARSSGRKLSEAAAEVAAGRPLPRGRTRPTPTQAEQPNGDAATPQRDA